MFIDTHAHLNHERFYGEVPQAIERARSAGVTTIVNVAFDMPSGWKAVELAEEYEGLWAVVGLHPHDAKDCTPALLDEVAQMMALEHVVGIGEAGLDFYYDNSPRPQQKAVFAEFVQMAAATGKPLVVHSRDAEQATLEVLDAHLKPGQKVVMHCFGADANFARNCIARGFLMGVAGTVTFPNAKALQQVIQKAPIEHLILETDCPYLAPQARRGRRNEPSFIPLIAEFVAQLRGITVEEIAAATTANARAFYGIP
jgi:TatD DNase family protein